MFMERILSQNREKKQTANQARVSCIMSAEGCSRERTRARREVLFSLSKETAMTAKTRPCVICGQSIDPERIEVIPETQLCGDHAREIVRLGGEFVLTGKQTSIGKAGSLKKNYGDVSIEKQR